MRHTPWEDRSSIRRLRGSIAGDTHGICASSIGVYSVAPLTEKPKDAVCLTKEMQMSSPGGQHRPDSAHTTTVEATYEEAQSINYYLHAVLVDGRSQTADNLFSHHPRCTAMASSRFLSTKAFPTSASQALLGNKKQPPQAPSHKR